MSECVRAHDARFTGSVVDEDDFVDVAVCGVVDVDDGGRRYVACAKVRAYDEGCDRRSRFTYDYISFDSLPVVGGEVDGLAREHFIELGVVDGRRVIGLTLDGGFAELKGILVAFTEGVAYALEVKLRVVGE